MNILVSGNLINYEDEGTGQVILLLHGWGASLQSFDALTRTLSKSNRVVRLDFPGFGGSPQPSNDWDIGDYADLVVSFLKKKGINKLHAAIVHSFGGRVIIKAVGQGLLDPERIVLIGSGGIKHPVSPRQQVYKLIAKTGKYITKLPVLSRMRGKLRSKLYNSAGVTDYLQSGGMRPIFLNVIAEDLRDLAANIKQPTLLIWGKDDHETPVTDGEILHERIKSSKLVVIPNAGHFTYLDQPEKVQKEIEDFLL
ncbi:MAG: alpha/beta hydrolase [Candidatus Saccharimonadales bacterium]